MSVRNPLVSILVPVYNVGKYLDKCLGSLVNQTLKNIEIICVNDGSTDNSAEILKKFATNDSRIKVINKKNGGLPSARNAGLDAARGRYVGFVDADDYVEHNMFERLYYEAQRKNADVVVCGAHIFPNEDQAPRWLFDVLSPNDAVFKKNGVDVLLYEKGARPFLWRNLVRKKLIDKYELRLDENIVVGEDLAFQFKVFPHAKRIAFVSDKLYYYRWGRQGSIMKDLQYKDSCKKLQCHLNLIEHIAKCWETNGLMKNNANKFFEWAIEFIYWDIIKVSACDRSQLCKRFCNILIKYGYYNNLSKICDRCNDQYNYMYSQIGNVFNEPKVSVVISIEGVSDFLYECIDSVLNQTLKDIEVLIYNVRTNENAFGIVNKFLHADSRIAMRWDDWNSVAETYNDAVNYAKGEYVFFLKARDFYINNNVIENIVNVFDTTNAQLVGYINGASLGVNNVKTCECSNFYDFAYQLELLRKNEICFEDYSFLTGSMFFTKYCLSSNNTYNLGNQFRFENKILRAQSVPPKQVKSILLAIISLARLANEYHLEELQGRLNNMLNSENYVRLITNSTYEFMKYQEIGQNKNYKSEIFKLLVEINKLLPNKNHKYAVNKTLAMYVRQIYGTLAEY